MATWYGTTYSGGASDAGTVFRLAPAGKVSILHEFTGNEDGATPQPPLVQGSDGNFYGVTLGGGNNGLGTVFRITPAGSLITLYRFTGNGDGGGPIGGLVLAKDGNFYGTTSHDPADVGQGTIFRLTSTGELTTLHTFYYDNNGGDPQGGLIQASQAKPAGPSGSFRRLIWEARRERRSSCLCRPVMATQLAPAAQ